MTRNKKYHQTQKTFSLILILLLTIAVLAGTLVPKLKTIYKNQAAENNLSNPYNKTASLNNIQYPRNNFISISRGPNLILNSYFTIEFWFNLRQRANFFNQTLLHIGSNLNVFTESGSGPSDKIAIITGDGSKLSSAVGPELILNKWYHLAVTYIPNTLVPNTGKITLYLNGEAVVSKENVSFKDQLHVINVGESIYDGIIDEIRISNNLRYNETLSQTPTMPFTDDSNTLVLLHLDGDVNDSSSNLNNGSINNTVTFIDSTIPFIMPTQIPTPTSKFQPKPTFLIPTIINKCKKVGQTNPYYRKIGTRCQKMTGCGVSNCNPNSFKN